ncbi:MAG: recombination protein RecR, partial [Deltaproteobacteria bacterium]|nr:recombination protein RecR [Deltaproteobacteria bacterium]
NSEGRYAEELAESLISLKGSIKTCRGCFGFSDNDPCGVCSDAARDPSVVCVVSDFKDMSVLESSGSFNGRYHVLNGTLSPLKGIGPDEIRIKELISKVQGNGVREVIIATGFDVEGEVTATYLTGALRLYGLKLTRIASGVPTGSYIEYMDARTLAKAMEGRRDL